MEKDLHELKQKALEVLDDIMRHSRIERNRLDAARILLQVIAALEKHAPPSRQLSVLESAFSEIEARGWSSTKAKKPS
ncbi:MAG: hypothetical protein QXI60_05300 [Thermofilaceae archaeon]